jgi:hypothetical protein
MIGSTPIVVRSTFSDAPGTLVGDVVDERPLVGLATLPSMDTVVLPAGAVAPATREAWERSRLLMSIVNPPTGEVVVGAADHKTAELREALREAALEPSRLLGRCGWLSVIGEPGALGEQHPRWMARFRAEGVEVRAHELTARRATYVVPEAARRSAAQTVYEAIAEQG